MLTMKRMADEEKQELLNKLGVFASEAFVYEARERGERTGYAVFEWLDGKATVTLAEYGGDLDLLDGLIRSGMAWLDDNRISALYFGKNLDEAALRALFFVTDHKNYIDSVHDFLKTCKKCKL